MRCRAPDDDVLADRYVQADETLRRAGFEWYEVSNWARTAAARSPAQPAVLARGELVGHRPGRAQPRRPACGGGTSSTRLATPQLLEAGRSPAAGRETLTERARLTERLMLGVRLREGLDLRDLPRPSRAKCLQLVTWGLAEPAASREGRLVLTQRGRLLADAVVRELLG